MCGGRSGALLEDDGQLSVGRDRGSAHLVEFVERGGGRLLDHDVRAGGERLEGLTVMRSGWRADEHDVGVLGGEQFAEVVVDGRHVPLLGEVVGHRSVQVCHGHEFGVRV